MAHTLDDAAAAALFMLELTKPQDRENLGALYSTDAGYGRSNIIESGQDSHVRGTLSLPHGSPLAALFHNHPAISGDEAHRAQFSPDDKAQAQRLKVPSYISAGDRIERFDPSTGKTEDVLAEFPIEEFKTFLMQRLLNRAPDDPRGLRL
jgi:hypothetical protein